MAGGQGTTTQDTYPGCSSITHRLLLSNASKEAMIDIAFDMYLMHCMYNTNGLTPLLSDDFQNRMSHAILNIVMSYLISLTNSLTVPKAQEYRAVKHNFVSVTA